MKSLAIHFKSTILATAFALCYGTAFAQTIYSDGHADFGVVFEDPDWFIHYHFDVGAILDDIPITLDEEFEPSDVIVQLGDSAKITLLVPVAFLDANAGDDIWLIPQAQLPGVPWLGFSTEELDSSWGQITFALSSFSDPGTSRFGQQTRLANRSSRCRRITAWTPQSTSKRLESLMHTTIGGLPNLAPTN